ncbi:MAG: ABC transporter ATP-binding protein [Rhizobiaceae bacterium]|nr:ABC transporter ATP-binding protein [Rhizobiaceae bacterium]
MDINQPPVLELDGVGRRFGRTAALSDVSLCVSAGEIVCLVGHSGCGKSSLLRIISGVDPDHQGRVAMAGRTVAGPSVFVEPEARSVGFVFQDYALFPHLSMERNIAFGLSHLPRAEADRRVAEMIGHVGIGHLAGRYPHMLSGGEQQRVALARALAPQPAILLMDEPFSNLDRGLREQVRTDTLSLLRRLATTVVIVTHDPEEALSVGDRIVLLQSGRIVQTGSGYDLYDRPQSRYAAEFFGGFNALAGTCRNGIIETPLGTFEGAPASQEGASVRVYLRPQSFEISEGEGEFQGRIVGRQFLGEVEQLVIGVETLQAPLRVRTMRRIPRDREVVGLTVRRAEAIAFAA